MSHLAYKYKGKLLPAEAYSSETYFSLATSKMVKGASGPRKKYLVENGPRVYGTPEEYSAFLEENNESPPPPTKFIYEEKKAAPSPSTKLPGRVIPKPSVACHPSQLGVISLPEGLSDVEAFPENEIGNICDFHLKGLKGKGKITEVIDGDTMRLLVYVELKDLAHKQVMKRRGGSQLQAPIAASRGGGFFTIYKVRLLGLDTAEKVSKEGQLAKKLTVEKYATLGNIVFYTFEGFDKYGRILATFYADKERMINLNTFLIDDPPKDELGAVIQVAEFYDGGTKSEYMKRLVAQGKGAVEADKYLPLVEDEEEE